jgi:hypothetical protein
MDGGNMSHGSPPAVWARESRLLADQVIEASRRAGVATSYLSRLQNGFPPLYSPLHRQSICSREPRRRQIGTAPDWPKVIRRPLRACCSGYVRHDQLRVLTVSDLGL